MDIIEEIKDMLSSFKNLYDSIRVVGPLNKEVLFNDGRAVQDVKNNCYCSWNKDTFCENCISMRAYLEDDTFVKLEYLNDQVFLIIATPVVIRENRYIVEIIKDISKIGYMRNKKINGLDEQQSLIYQMNDKIIKDELTGIYNRRYIDERLPVDINNSTYGGEPISVIMADIDFFKNVNDNYGHVIGDKVLKEFAKLLMDSIRKNTDWVGRYGGEEFLIVLNNTNTEEAYKRSEELRKLVEKRDFCFDNLTIKITASFGAYSLNNTRLDSESLISNADKNLYKAKRTGRNKTIINEH
ncbi:GGDEF domain-containing protein [Candidatus Clostridium stratigraminis]|uniref:GGDEF domain-containing protein n=1 Tax=Candidatus Clostridium stratigraminis TaxID=3381661 RepID=A0ABW8T7J1_9CLOT